MKFLLSLTLLIMVGCTYSPSPSYSQEGWNEVKRQYDNATSWDELPYPWRIELKGKYWCTEQNVTTAKELTRRQSEVKQLLQKVNEKRHQWYVNDHPELLAHTAECILAGRVHLGMTREQVIASKGEIGDVYLFKELKERLLRRYASRNDTRGIF